MNEVIDFKTRKKTEQAQEGKSVKELIESVAQHEEIGGMVAAIVVLLKEDDTGRMWIHNLTDRELLWQAEMLKVRALFDDGE